MRLSESREQKNIAFEKLCREIGKIEAMKKMELDNKIKSELENLHIMLDHGYYGMAHESIKRIMKINMDLSYLK
jgi:hypothetical protein